MYNAFFVDLFVRVSNTLAINMYNAFGYSVYRRVIGYYSGEEDAFGETRQDETTRDAQVDGCRSLIRCCCIYYNSIARTSRFVFAFWLFVGRVLLFCCAVTLCARSSKPKLLFCVPVAGTPTMVGYWSARGGAYCWRDARVFDREIANPATAHSVPPTRPPQTNLASWH